MTILTLLAREVLASFRKASMRRFQPKMLIRFPKQRYEVRSINFNSVVILRPALENEPVVDIEYVATKHLTGKYDSQRFKLIILKEF